MYLVIPYKQDPHNGLELRYAIRSIVKHFTDFTGVILVGDRPDWYTGQHVPAADVNKRKEFSIYRKLISCGIPGPVLYSNDDYYALENFGSDLPNYYDYTCGEKKPRNSTYRELYRNAPREWLNFDVHTPMIIDITKFTDWPIDRPIKSAYANPLKLPGTQIEDCKIRGEWEAADIWGRIKGRPFFSTHENAHRGDMLKVLNKLYAEPSPFERT